jgi:phosphoribosylanthranilate isomerase
VISEEMIASITKSLPPAVSTFLLTSKQDAASIIAQQRRCRTNTIQICDRLETGTYDELREALPGIALVQVIHVCGEDSIEEAVLAAPHVDAILLDSGNQRLAVKELGGTGRAHDWAISRKIRDAVDKSIFLAGGLKPDNVREAIRTVEPFGIDICSGVRTEGMLDSRKLASLFDRVMCA